MTRDIETKTAVHVAPTWQRMADFIILADLSEYGMPNCWEQIWARKIEDDEFMICCIPFFTYGIALGDHVRTHMSNSREYIISAMVKAKGHRVVRLWLKELDRLARIQIGRFVCDESLLTETGSADLLAIDLPDDIDKQQRVIGYFESLVSEQGLLLEMGN